MELEGRRNVPRRPDDDGHGLVRLGLVMNVGIRGMVVLSHRDLLLGLAFAQVIDVPSFSGTRSYWCPNAREIDRAGAFTSNLAPERTLGHDVERGLLAER